MDDGYPQSGKVIALYPDTGEAQTAGANAIRAAAVNGTSVGDYDLSTGGAITAATSSANYDFPGYTVFPADCATVTAQRRAVSVLNNIMSLIRTTEIAHFHINSSDNFAYGLPSICL
jgi:hypothetical protein